MGSRGDKGPLFGGGDLRANSEQMGALSRDIAPVLAGMYHGLVAEGVPPEVAGLMASDFFGKLVVAMGGKQ